MCKSVNDNPTNFHPLRRRSRLVWPPSDDAEEMARKLKAKCQQQTTKPSDLCTDEDCCCIGDDCVGCEAAHREQSETCKER